MQTMRTFFIGSCTEEKSCFSKIYKGIPDSGLGGGIQLAFLPATRGRGPYRRQQTGRLNKDWGRVLVPRVFRLGFALKVL